MNGNNMYRKVYLLDPPNKEENFRRCKALQKKYCQAFYTHLDLTDMLFSHENRLEKI